jgi:hypothetical protein
MNVIDVVFEEFIEMLNNDVKRTRNGEIPSIQFYEFIRATGKINAFNNMDYARISYPKHGYKYQGIEESKFEEVDLVFKVHKFQNKTRPYDPLGIAAGIFLRGLVVVEVDLVNYLKARNKFAIMRKINYN